MVKRKSFMPLCMVIVLAACGSGQTTEGDNQTRTQATASTTPVESPFITRDSANKMIGSYLTSINYPGNPDSLRSWTIDAEALREFLANKDITGMKVMLAHNLDYINAGNNGHPAAFSPAALTLVVAGFNASGDYVYYEDNAVINRAKPCPHTCLFGTAASPTLTNP